MNIPARSAVKVQIHSPQSLSDGYDYVLEPLTSPPYNATCYALLISSKTTEVILRNDTNNLVRVQRHAPLGYAVPLQTYGVYYLDSN